MNADDGDDASGNGGADADDATVLVVDDSSDLVDLYASWLRGEYDVLTATGGEEALATVSGAVDVVLLDRRMPDLSGEDVLEEIRARGHDCRVAVVTAVEPDVDVVGMGFDDYLIKPVSKAELRRTVRQLCAVHDYDDLLQEYFALASKTATLEANVGAAELDGNADYERLVERLADVERNAADRLAELGQGVGDWQALHRVVVDEGPTESGSVGACADGADD
ncbi:MAG: response regulator [Haloferacaceae archaeon]